MRHIAWTSLSCFTLWLASSCANTNQEPLPQAEQAPAPALIGQPVAVPPQSAPQPVAPQPVATQPAAPQPVAAQPAASQPVAQPQPSMPSIEDAKAKIQEKVAELAEKPIGEGIIRAFWGLVDKDKYGAATALLDPSAGGRNMWKQSLSSIDSAKVGSVVPHDKASWSAEEERYKVEISIKCKPDDPAAPPPMPCNGWNDGANTRWMSVKKTGIGGRIAEIATGP